MDNFEKKLDLSLRDLKRIRHRLQAMGDDFQRYMSFLERSADECWAYPDADEKYDSLSKAMVKVEEKQIIISESLELITEIEDNLSKMK